jgi:hypothetical protein
MSKMYIRVKKDGFIYAYNEIMAANPLCEVVSEEIAYPERFVPPKAAKRKARLDLTTEDIPEGETPTNAQLAADASKGLPK